MTHSIAHPLDPERLSAYYDGELEEAERREVEEHLASCAGCCERLEEYAWLGSDIRAGEVDAAPITLDARVADLLLADRKRASWAYTSRFWLPRPAMAAALLVALLSAFLIFGLHQGNGVEPLVASAYLYEDQGQTAIAVEFTGPVDHAKVEQTLRIEPAVDVTVAWRGNTMLVKPSQPLQPKASYTVRVNPEGPGSKATPVALPVLPAKPTPTAPASTPRGAATGLTLTPTPSATPTPVASPSQPSPTASAATPASQGTLTPEGIQPVRGFGLLYRSRPEVAAKLGKALEPERGVEMVAQPFQGGRLLWRGDRKEILALLQDGRWQSYADTFAEAEATPSPSGEPVRGFGKIWREHSDLRGAVGAPTAPEQPIGAAVQPFEHGLMVWTDDGTIYVLYDDGSWERYVDTFVDSTATSTPTTAAMPTATKASATPTPSQGEAWLSSTPAPTAAASSTTPAGESRPTGTPSATPSAIASPSPTPTIPQRVPTATSTVAPTAMPTATPTATPIGSGCPTKLVRGFALVYQENPEVATRLGCAEAAETAVQLVRQGFEHGLMLWRADTREILALRADGRWSLHQDSYQEGEKLDEAGPAPPGKLVPERGLGKLWRQRPDLREGFGWATVAEQPVAGAIQQFSSGTMLWTSDRVIYVLYPDGTWRGFADTFVDPSAPPQ